MKQPRNSYVKLQFDKAIPGDKVWHLNYGWGIVRVKHLIGGDITVEFGTGDIKTYTHSGYAKKSCYSPDDVQVLFWDEFKIEKPGVPMRSERLLRPETLN